LSQQPAADQALPHLTVVRWNRYGQATVSSKGQIAIPKAVREELNLKRARSFRSTSRSSDSTAAVVAEYPDWRTMRGMVPPGPSLSKGIEEDRAWELEHDEWIGRTRPVLDSWAIVAWMQTNLRRTQWKE